MVVEQIAGKAMEEAEDEPAEEQAGEGAKEDVAWIVQAEIDAAVAGETRPQKDCDDGEDIEPTTSEDAAQIDG